MKQGRCKAQDPKEFILKNPNEEKINETHKKNSYLALIFNNTKSLTWETVRRRAVHALDWMSVAPKVLSWSLMPSVMVFEGASAGRWWGHDNETFWMGLVPWQGGRQRTPWPHLSHEDTVRNRLFMSQEEGFLQIPNLQAPWPWTSSFQSFEKEMLHSATWSTVVLLQQPELTEITH